MTESVRPAVNIGGRRYPWMSRGYGVNGERALDSMFKRLEKERREKAKAGENRK